MLVSNLVATGRALKVNLWRLRKFSLASSGGFLDFSHTAKLAYQVSSNKVSGAKVSSAKSPSTLVSNSPSKTGHAAADKLTISLIFIGSMLNQRNT